MAWTEHIRWAFLRGVLLASCSYGIVAPGHAVAPHPITAYNTYQVGPFARDDQHGLAHAIVALLNKKVAPAYIFDLRHIPRIRLEVSMLSKGDQFDGVVLFINPAFVGDNAATRFLWSKPLFVDCNVIVSRKLMSMQYTGPASLEGLRFGAVRGYRYSQIDELTRTGKVHRVDSKDELSSLQKVARGRADFTVIPYSIYSYLAADAVLSAQLFRADKHHRCFARRILIGKGNRALLALVNQAIDTLVTNKVWNATLAELHLDVDVLRNLAEELPPD